MQCYQKDKLYCISSGASATSEIERDVILVEALGADAKVDFISERLEKHGKFVDPIKRLNLKTLSSQNKIIEYRQQSNIAYHLLVSSQYVHICGKDNIRLSDYHIKQSGTDVSEIGWQIFQIVKSRIAILHPLTLASYHLEEVDLSVLFRKPSEVAILYWCVCYLRD
jgi:hypothetical protein